MSNPSDSRIYINYKKKNPVRFVYPVKFHPWQIIAGFFVGCVIYLLPIVFILLSFIYLNPFSALLPTFDFFFVGMITSFVIAFPLSYIPAFLKIMPTLQMYLGGGYLQTYKTVTIKKLEELKFEIPVFGNAFLDYKATKEFSKYLERVEIIENDFWVRKKSRIFKRMNSCVSLGDQWKATFYFKKNPTTGYLKVDFD